MTTSGAQGASRKTNGVGSGSGQQPAADAPKSNKSRTPVEGDKVVIRRLPPGMTEQEVWNNLDDEWKAGNGLVSWHNFAQGKISQDPAKPSRPGRVYLHVLKRESLNTLSTLIQAKSWEDAKMTSNSASLVGPPVLEFAIYNKVPSGKKRTDPRQGTIDQDPEFMAFLQSLTNPEMDKENENSENKEAEESKPEAKVTTTPLIEFIKEKKANKQKEAAAAKSAKQARQESSTKGKASASAAEDSKKGKKDSKGEKSTDKPKETVKILTKKATAEAAKAAETVASQITQASSSQDAPKSRRAGIAAAARILQRDLGISPGSAHRRARLDAAKAEAEAKATTTKEAAQPAAEPPAPTPTPVAAPAQSSSAASQTSERSTTPTAPKSGRSRRGGGGKNAGASDSKGKSTEASSSNTSAPAKAPVVLLKKKDEEKNKEKGSKNDKEASSSASQSAAPATNTKSNLPAGPKSSGKGGNSKKGSAAVTPGVTRGFVKHANPSQGVTEALLKQAMEAFGTVTFVEIDKRKGFAYVDFSDHDSLVKAVAASPVQVAQGTVQVLERKEKKPAAANSNAKSEPSSANAGAASSNSAAPSASGPANTATPSDKPEHHKRTRRGRGGGKTAANASGSNSGNKDARSEPAASTAGTG
ncbi:nonsense-mediated mRNA decay protein [Colletotrichum incanum]|nr:nonsense-mediated mRNA decay protein [Colletotrichum incanum]